jgi:glutathione peroxidase
MTEAQDRTEDVYGFSVPALEGGEIRLGDYRGQVMLLVNTASQCGFTPQYAGLESLWRVYRDRGFVLIGFPCNQFGGQEPGDGAEIAAFCATRYGVSFPLAAKIDVNGEHAHPLYRHLTRAATGLLGTEAIKWNFTKFLVDRHGRVVKRYAPVTPPALLSADIERQLG